MQKKLSQLESGFLKLPTAGSAGLPVVSLTSWRPRFGSLPFVLLNLLEQDLLPSKIIVWLADKDYDLFDRQLMRLFEQSIVEFRKTQDFGPHKKWLPLAQLSDEPFVICDDDIFYPDSWYRSLIEADDKLSCVAHRCHRLKLSPTENVLPYEVWDKDIEKAASSAHDLFAVGCGGVLIYPDRISKRFRNFETIENVCPKNDDIWLKLAHLDSNTPSQKTSYRLPCLEYLDTQAVGLMQTNVNQNGNDIQIKASLERLQLNFSALPAS